MISARKIGMTPFLFLLLGLFFVSACSDPEYEKAEMSLRQAQADVSSLGQDLANASQEGKNPKLPYVQYLKQYADVARRLNPGMDELISTLEQEGTVNGGSYIFLKSRLAAVSAQFTADARRSREAAIAVANEAAAISLATDPVIFNDSLVDVINVLADMTDGQLPKFKMGETKDKSMPPTQHLVGNPQYGHWGHNAGSNFWIWYGQYAMLSNVLGWNSGYRYSQDYWYRSRSGSYYGDVGRHYYGTNKSNAAWSSSAKKYPNVAANKVSQSTVRNFKSTNRLSTYAPKTSAAPKSMAKSYAAKNTSSYSNSRSSPSRTGGYGGARGGK